MNSDRCHLFAVKNGMTDRILHLDKDARGNSIANGCYPKTEQSIMLRGSQNSNGGNQGTLQCCRIVLYVVTQRLRKPYF